MSNLVTLNGVIQLQAIDISQKLTRNILGMLVARPITAKIRRREKGTKPQTNLLLANCVISSFHSADWLFSCYMPKTFLVFATAQNTVQGCRKDCILVEDRGEGRSRGSRLTCRT